ncbi:cystatin-like [Hoplias malabaricus]|uniref:cystatin-like n=1 Tax=Hoplias malabaricus TaxID=27720 RepID=UPI0034636D5B
MSVKLVAVVLVLSLVAEGSKLPGAPMAADMNDPEVQKALHFAIAQHNRVSNDMWISHVTKVLSVHKQIVAGMKYLFTVEMARTSCRKGRQKEVFQTHCDSQVARPHVCKLAVWTQAWIKKIQVTEDTCL